MVEIKNGEICQKKIKKWKKTWENFQRRESKCCKGVILYLILCNHFLFKCGLLLFYFFELSSFFILKFVCCSQFHTPNFQISQYVPKLFKCQILQCWHATLSIDVEFEVNAHMYKNELDREKINFCWHFFKTKVITNCYTIKSIHELFIKNQVGPLNMSSTIKSILKLFILSINLIFDTVK